MRVAGRVEVEPGDRSVVQQLGQAVQHPDGVLVQSRGVGHDDQDQTMPGVASQQPFEELYLGHAPAPENFEGVRGGG